MAFLDYSAFYLILGLGLSGQAAAKFLLSRGCRVAAIDDRFLSLKENSSILQLLQMGLQIFERGEHPPITSFDALIVSPGVSPAHPIYHAALTHEVEIIGEAELALRHLSHTCVGVTGTNGKTTVTSLIAHLLECAGRPAKAVGNIGIPLTALLNDPESLETILIIELSSFQLETLQTRSLQAAILLNITPDHLDRHHSLAEYARLKGRIFDCVKKSGHCYTSNRCQTDWPELTQARPLICYDVRDDLTTFNQNALFASLRSHERENALAAYAVVERLGVSPCQFLTALTTFKKPPHRLELVKTIAGVTYINDSKATNVDAVARAVEALDRPLILIVGGVDKGASYCPWLKPFTHRVRALFAIGLAADKIIQELGEKLMVNKCSTLAEAVTEAAKFAVAGDIILLSPGCASYDMFADYADRGRAFQKCVDAL